MNCANSILTEQLSLKRKYTNAESEFTLQREMSSYGKWPWKQWAKANVFSHNGTAFVHNGNAVFIFSLTNDSCIVSFCSMPGFTAEERETRSLHSFFWYISHIRSFPVGLKCLSLRSAHFTPRKACFGKIEKAQFTILRFSDRFLTFWFNRLFVNCTF